jgi:hypothetical protein
MPEEKKIEERKIEEAEVNAYMECADGQKPNENERRDWLRARYMDVIREYKQLLLLKEEVEYRKNDEAMNRLTQSFRENYKTRRWVVTELRKIGDTVEDKFVPRSAT